MPAKRDLSERLWGKVNKGDGCWIWTGCKCKSKQSYGMIQVERRCVRAHRVVWELTYGPIPRGLKIMHKCDNYQCVNPEHLILGTDADNLADAARKNRMHHKLETRDVIEIRRLFMEGFTQVELAKMFSLNQSTVSRIVHKKRRQHV